MLCLLAAVFFPPNAHAVTGPSVRLTPTPDTMTKGGFVDLRVEITPGTATGEMTAVRLTMKQSGEAVAVWESITQGKKIDQWVYALYIGDAQLGIQIPMVLYYTDAQGNEKTVETGFVVLKGVEEVAQEAKITFTRTSSPSAVQGAELADLTYTVRNEGKVAVLNLVIIDDLLGAVASIPALAPGMEEVVIAQVVPGENIISQPRLTYTNIITQQTFTSTLEPLAVVISQPKLAVLLKTDQTSIRAGEPVTFTYTVLNEGNVIFYDVQLSDEQDGMMPGTDKLEPGESYVYNKTEKLVMSAEYSFVVAARDGMGKNYSVTSNAIAVQVTDTDTAAPATDVLNISATLDITVLKEPGKVRFAITVKNTSPEPVVDVVISEAGVGVIERMEKFPTGDKIFYYQTEVSASSQFAFTVEGHLGDAQGARVQATTQTLMVEFQTPQPVTFKPWDDTLTPAPTTMESEQTGTQPLTPAPKETNWLLIALAVVGLLIVVCVLLLIRAFRKERQPVLYDDYLPQQPQEYLPQEQPIVQESPELSQQPQDTDDEVTQPHNAPPRALDDVPTRPHDVGENGQK